MVNILKFSFLTFAARFKFWNLILLSLFILRHFQKVESISVGRSKHDIFYFFGEKTPANVVKVLVAILNPE